MKPSRPSDQPTEEVIREYHAGLAYSQKQELNRLEQERHFSYVTSRDKDRLERLVDEVEYLHAIIAGMGFEYLFAENSHDMEFCQPKPWLPQNISDHWANQRPGVSLPLLKLGAITIKRASYLEGVEVKDLPPYYPRGVSHKLEMGCELSVSAMFLKTIFAMNLYKSLSDYSPVKMNLEGVYNDNCVIIGMVSEFSSSNCVISIDTAIEMRAAWLSEQ